MAYFFSEDLRICQMASFPIITIADNRIDLLIPYIDKMIHHYPNAPHDAYRRNAVRTWQFIDIPEAYEGEIYDICISEFCDVKRPTAIRAFATTVLTNICTKHPGLKEELLPLFHDFIDTGTVGFQNRIRKEIVRIGKV